VANRNTQNEEYPLITRTSKINCEIPGESI
jgi:hypothetical protein